tara:strand:+ start:4863 stop:5390 length:528 start_codon:yes stop_codon:yes gene_type:complete
MTHFPTHDFQVGDIVKLRHASAPQRVTEVFDHVISTEYLNTHHTYHKRAAAQFELISEEENTTMTKKLFKTADDQYGTMLTKDSQGNYVLELKGSNDVKAFDPKTLEEVLPYTVLIQWASGAQKHYEVSKGSLSKGDIVISDQGLILGRVEDIDTKNRNPSSNHTFQKVGTSPIK